MPIGVQQFKLGALLSFNPGNSIANMTRVGRAFQSFQKQTNAMRAGMLKMSAGFATLRFLPTGFSRGMAGAIKTAMDFEQQMSNVASVAQDAVGPNFVALQEEAKRLGIVSAFSAKEAADGMEYLGRAGFDTSQIITAIGPVLNAAAADSIDLGTSADIVSNVLRAMGEDIQRAGHVANVLALTSARTNTNITGLGDAFRYAASTGREMGFSVDETASALGWLANAGLKGSVAGTSFTNMMVKLTKPTDKARAFMEEYKIKLTDAGGKMKDLADIVEMFIGPLNKMNDDAERAGMVAEIFGIRGKKAYSAFSVAGVEALRNLTEEMKNADAGIGAAGRMAQIRLDNLAGAITLFRSSMQGLAIETVAGIGLPLKEGVQAITNFVNTMIMTLKGVGEKEMTALFEGMAGTPMVLLETAQSVGRGIREFFAWFGGAFETVKARVAPIIPYIDSLSEGTKKFLGMLMIGLPIMSGLLAPLIALLGLFVPAIGAGLAIISGAVGASIAALKLLAIPLLGIYTIFSRLKGEGESWGSFLLRMFTTVKDSVVGFATSFWNTFGPFVGFMKTELIATFNDLVNTLAPAFRRIGDMFGFATGGAGSFGERVGWLLGVVTMAITTAIKFSVWLIKIFTLPVRAVLALGEYIGIAAAAVVEFFINAYDKAREIVGRIGSVFSGMAEIIRTKIQAIAEIWRPYFEPVFNWIGQRINRVIEIIKMVGSVASFVGSLIASGVGLIGNLIYAGASSVWEFLVEGFNVVSSTIGSVARGAWSVIAGIISVASGVLSSAWANIKSAFSGMIEFVRPIAEKVLNFMLLPLRGLSLAISKVLGLKPIVETLKVLGWDVSTLATQMSAFATEGIKLAAGGFLKGDTNARVHKNELVMPLDRFTRDFMPRVAEETIPATIERIKEREIIRERARAVMPEVRPEIIVNVPDNAPREVTVRNVITLDGIAIARALGNAEITEGLRTGRTRQMSPSEVRTVGRTGFRR